MKENNVIELVEDEHIVTENDISEAKVTTTNENKILKKHDKAKILVVKAKQIVKDAEDQMESCKLLLSDDLKGYDDAMNALKEGGMNACDDLLEALNFVSLNENETDMESKSEDKESIVFEPKDEIEPVQVKDISSGRFTGVLLSLIGGGVTFSALMYYATSKLGIVLDTTKVPSSDTLQTIFGWFGTQVGRVGDATNGALMVGLSVVVVMGIIYAIRVSLRANKNLDFANKQLEDAEEYSLFKGNCKEEMDKVDLHINDAIDTLTLYKVILNEQKGKLERILHLEGKEEAELHEKSLLELKDTKELIDTVKEFMALSMSEEGKLSGKSTLFLHRAKSRIEKMIERLY